MIDRQVPWRRDDSQRRRSWSSRAPRLIRPVRLSRYARRSRRCIRPRTRSTARSRASSSASPGRVTSASKTPRSKAAARSWAVARRRGGSRGPTPTRDLLQEPADQFRPALGGGSHRARIGSAGRSSRPLHPGQVGAGMDLQAAGRSSRGPGHGRPSRARPGARARGLERRRRRGPIRPAVLRSGSSAGSDGDSPDIGVGMVMTLEPYGSDNRRPGRVRRTRR